VAVFERELDLDPGSVWNVLQDPASYPQWVAGAIEVVDVDRDWPAVGAAFRYAFRWGPFRRSGQALVLESHPPGHLVLRWSRGLASDSIAHISMSASARSSVLRIVENPTGLRGAPLSGFSWLAGPSANARSLERLADLARRRQHS
jgi:uncharacterized protein YndB with AHSA1/START domain